MACRMHFADLHASPRFRLTDVRCPGIDGSRRREEIPDETTLVFVRAGSFLRTTSDGREELGDPGHVLVFPADEGYRARHPFSGGDRCTSLGLGQAILEELPGLLALPSSFPVGPELFLSHARVFSAAREKEPERERVEEALLHLVDGLVRQAFEPVARHAATSLRSPRNAALAQEARQLLVEERPRTTPPLEELARTLGVSVFHLCRVFRANVGATLHGYRNALRLRGALERLADGVSDLSALALELGFSSHSHFTSAFRREFGVVPSAFRAGALGRSDLSS